MDKQKDGFHTLRGYRQLESGGISYAMEDYLEMICRLEQQKEKVRIKDLATLLNVGPSSASKMAAKLRDNGFLEFERYGVIHLTAAGKRMGEYLLLRHAVLHRFFCRLNGSENELELVEKIEHYMDARTIRNMQEYLDKYCAEG